MDEDDFLCEEEEDDEDDDVLVEDLYGAYTPGKFRWVDLAITGVQLVEDLGDALVGGVANVKRLLMLHANYRNNRERFSAEASRELETIMSSNDDS
jgi:hypothetical protein